MADGSVIIDTGLDNSGIEMDAKEIESRVKSLCSSVDKFGANLQKSAKGYASNIGDILSQEFGTGLEGAKAKLDALANAKIPTDEYKKVCDEIEKVNTSLDKLNEKQDKLRSTGADQPTAKWQENQQAIEEATAALEKYKQVLQEAQEWKAELTSGNAEDEAISGGPEAYAEYKASVAAVNEEISQNIEWIKHTEASLDQLIAKQEQLKASSADQGSKQWQSLQYDIEQTRQKLEELNATQQRMESSGASHTLGSQTQEYQRLSGEVSRLDMAMQAASSVSQAFHSIMGAVGQAVSSAGSSMATFGANVGSGLTNALGTAADRARNFLNTMAQASLESFSNGVRSAVDHLKSFVSHIGQGLAKLNPFKSALQGAVNTLKSFGSQASRTALTSNGLVRALTSLKTMLVTRIKRTFISGLFSGVQEGVQNLARLSSAFNQTMSNITNRTAQLRNNIAIAVSGLIQALEPVILRIISLLNSAVVMVNQFIAAIGGKSTYQTAKLGNADYAKSLNNTSKSANNAAKASGNAAKAAGNAGKAAGHSAQAIENTAKASNKAAKAQKEWNAELYSFDELNRQADKDQDDSDSDSGGDDGLFDTPGDMPLSDPGDFGFEPATIQMGDNLLDMFGKLKKAFKGGDWFKIGEEAAEALNNALKKIDDWINNKFRPAAVKWAKNATDFVNGFVKAFDWELLGKTIADGFNAIFDAVNTFLTRVDWFALGRGIGRAIKSWFDNIEWDLIGQTFANAFNALINTIKGIVTTPGIWTSIGKSLGTMLKNLFQNIDYNGMVDVLIAFFKGIPEAIKAFLDQDPFKGVPQKIASAINRVIHEVNWQDLAQQLANLFLYIIDNLRQIVAGIDWEGVFAALKTMAVVIGNALIKWIGSIDWKKVGEVFAAGWNALMDTILQLVGNKEFWEGLGKKVAEFVKGLFSKIDVKKTGDALVAVINGAITALKSFLASNPFKEILPKIQELLKNVLSNINPAALLAAFFLPGLKKAVKEFIKKRPVWPIVLAAVLALGPELGSTLQNMVNNIDFEAVGKAISDALKGALERLNEAISSVDWAKLAKSIGDGLIGMIKNIDFKTIGSDISDLLKNTLNGLSEAIESVDWVALGNAIWSALVDMVSNIDWNGIVDAASRLLGAAFGALVGLATPIADALKSAWEGVKGYFSDYIDQFGGNIVAGLLAGIINGLVNIGAWIVEHIFQPFIDGFKSAFGIASPSTVMEEMGGFLIEGLLQGITNLWHTITDFFTTALEGLTTMFTTAWEGIKTGAETAWEGIKTTVTTAFEGAKTALSTTAEGIKTGLTTAWNGVKTGAETAWEGIKTTVTTAFEGAKTALSTTAEGIKTGLTTAWNGIKTTASTAWESVKTTATTKFQQLRTSVVSAWNNLKTSLSNVQWSNVGANLVNGLKSGISGAWGGLMNSVKSLVNSLISRVKSFFGVHSPSTVFAEIGEFLDAGLENGLQDGEGKLLRTAAEIANNVTDGMTPDEPHVQMTADGVVSSMQAVISGLSGIAEIFRTIADSLAATGGFRVPQIAEGSVVPYKTRIDDSSSKDDDSDSATVAYLLAILNELQAIARNLQNGDNTSDGVFKIKDFNGRTLFEMVIDENEKAIRRTGMSPLRT